MPHTVSPQKISLQLNQSLFSSVLCKEYKTVSQKDCKHLSCTTRFYLGELQVVKFKDDLLMITTHPEGDYKIVVPNNFQYELLIFSHKMDDSGMNLKESGLKLYNDWYNMQADTRIFAQSCTSCQVSKLTRNVVNNRNLGEVKINQVSPDFIGPLQPATNDVSYVCAFLQD